MAGTWINQEYLKILVNTRSPKAACYANLCVPFFEIEGLNIGWGIHVGDGLRVTAFSPTPNPNEFYLLESENEKTPHRFVISPQDSLRKLKWIGKFGDRDTAITQHFMRLDDSLNHYCNRVVVAGTYIDQYGQTYVFSVDGIAKWPKKTFRYEVGLDYAFSELDYLINWDEFDSTKAGWVAYGFKWEDHTLSLFREKPPDPEQGENTIFEETPFVILRPQ